MTIQYECRHCGEEIDVEVTINEEDDLPENCPHCDAPIPGDAHEKVNEDAIAQAMDSSRYEIYD